METPRLRRLVPVAEARVVEPRVLPRVGRPEPEARHEVHETQSEPQPCDHQHAVSPWQAKTRAGLEKAHVGKDRVVERCREDRGMEHSVLGKQNSSSNTIRYSADAGGSWLVAYHHLHASTHPHRPRARPRPSRRLPDGTSLPEQPLALSRPKSPPKPYSTVTSSQTSCCSHHNVVQLLLRHRK